MKNAKNVLSKKMKNFTKNATADHRPHPAEFNIFAPMVEIYNSLEG